MPMEPKELNAEELEEVDNTSVQTNPGEPKLLAAESGPLEQKQTQTEEAPTVTVIKSFACSLSHQILTLIGVTFLFFELVFLTFYFDKFWFSFDLSMLGVIAILLLCLFSHFLLKVLESKQACSMLSFLTKGKPLVAYRKWIRTNHDGMTFGAKHVRWEAIDELQLTWFGNLIVKSRMVCGNEQRDPDVLIKIPFGVADNTTQIQFLNIVREKRPQVVLDNKLSKIDATLAKGAQITQIATAAIMSFVLLDVGYASFYYLELLKNLYLADTTLLQSKNSNDQEALRLFQRAETLRSNPLPISWVTSKFLNSSTVAAGLCIERARVLWLLGKKEEALQLCEKSFEYAPSSLRHRLYKTRLLVEDGKANEARAELDKLIAKKEDALLPRLYLLALSMSTNKEQASQQSTSQEYENQLAACYAETFGDEPYWPPGGNRFFTELWFSEDLRFLMDRFLNSQPNMERVLQKAEDLKNGDKGSKEDGQK